MTFILQSFATICSHLFFFVCVYFESRIWLWVNTDGSMFGCQVLQPTPCLGMSQNQEPQVILCFFIIVSTCTAICGSLHLRNSHLDTAHFRKEQVAVKMAKPKWLMGETWHGPLILSWSLWLRWWRTGSTTDGTPKDQIYHGLPISPFFRIFGCKCF